jgi:DNA repair protein RadC
LEPTTGHIRIKDLPEGERPRERLAAHGPEALSNAELLAIVLRTGTAQASALDIAEKLLAQFRNLGELASAHLDQLQAVRGIGRDKAVALSAAFTLARRMAREIRLELPVLDTPESVASLMREENLFHDVEHLHVLLVNSKRRLIRIVTVSKGTLDQTAVAPREVFRQAILANAAAIILAHNHPSGDPAPSEADVRVTRELVRAGQLLKIEVLDHIVLGRRSTERPKDYSSLRELGLFFS